MTEPSDDPWTVPHRARCPECGYTSRAKSFGAARAAGRAHAIRKDHSVLVEEHPEVDEL